MQFALTYAPGAYDTRSKVMGRQSAGVGFLRAVLAAKPERIWCYAPARPQAEVFAKDVVALSSAPPEVRFIPWDQPGRLAHAGTLYRPDPGLIDGGWRRQSHSGARAYSLCSVTHTLSSHNAMTAIAEILTAPVYPWDALICTSRVARDIVRHLLETRMEELRGRLGVQRFVLPQFPVIPLGVHLDDFAFTPEQRVKSRQALGLDEHDVAVLFAGRLTFHGKGHPMPMYLGLEAAARETGKPVCLILFGQFPNSAVEEVFRGEAARFAPSVRLLVLDGKEAGNQDIAWAAADIFTSLSDNVQETFGLTPVEAMAAGLPVVVSDWDGYKDTVRDGVDGLRVPTIIPAPGLGGVFTDRFDAGADDYDLYIGQVSLYAAVDPAAAGKAYAKLIADPDLRRRMGQSGRQRAKQHYDWSVVFSRYIALWDDLAERRRSDPHVEGENRRTRRPDRPDPFTLFRTFPSRSLEESTRLRIEEGVTDADIAGRLKLRSVSYARILPSIDMMTGIFHHLANGERGSAGTIRETMGQTAPGELERAVIWMIKMGLLKVEA